MQKHREMIEINTKRNLDSKKKEKNKKEEINSKKRRAHEDFEDV